MRTPTLLRELPLDELIARAKRGERDALDMLFERSQSMIERLVASERSQQQARVGLDRPSDVAQEAAMRAYRRFDSFRGHTEAEWRAWLRTIYKTRKIEALRTASRQKRSLARTVPLGQHAYTIAADGERPSTQIAHRQDWKQTLIHIYELPEAQKQAVWLCHLKERSVADVARCLDKTEAAVAGLLRRALQTLRARARNGTEDLAVDALAADCGEGKSERLTPHEVRMSEALLAYLHAREIGHTVDIDAFAAAYGELAADIMTMVTDIERIEASRPVQIERAVHTIDK